MMFDMARLPNHDCDASRCATLGAAADGGEAKMPPVTYVGIEMDSEYSFSLFDRTVAHPRPVWVTVLLVFIVYLPTLVASASLGLTDLLINPRSRSVLTAPTAIAYILVIGPIIWSMQPKVINSLRPIILVDDQELARVVRRASSIPPLYEAAAIAVGFFFAFLISGGIPGPGERWQVYVPVATGYVMCGLLGWLGFTAIANTRVISQLLRLPMRVDPLDIKPFEAIGRQSLVIAFAFIGGNTLALLLGNYGSAALANPRFWLLFAPLFLLPVAVFFLNMIPTQRVLSQAKNSELAAVRGELHAAFRLLLERRLAGESSSSLAQDVDALAAYEQYLSEASSWPYNPAILRTLIFGVLVPISTVLARRVFEVYIR
jgi:hypothetical protein